MQNMIWTWAGHVVTLYVWILLFIAVLLLVTETIKNWFRSLKYSININITWKKLELNKK